MSESTFWTPAIIPDAPRLQLFRSGLALTTISLSLSLSLLLSSSLPLPLSLSRFLSSSSSLPLSLSVSLALSLSLFLSPSLSPSLLLSGRGGGRAAGLKPEVPYATDSACCIRRPGGLAHLLPLLLGSRLGKAHNSQGSIELTHAEASSFENSCSR